MRNVIHRITDCTIKFQRETGAILSPVCFRQDWINKIFMINQIPFLLILQIL